MSETADGFFGDLGRERAIVLGGLMLGMLLGSIDQSIVSTALPHIVGELGDPSKLSWIVTAYLVTVTATTPLYGKLSDLYGRSIVYEFAIAVFLIGSALSGVAGDIPVVNAYVGGMTQLAVFRALQGIGAGGLIAMATTILGDIFSPRERGKYMSYMMVIFGVATIGGPILGGWLTDNYTWRYIFYINIPIGLAAIAVIHTQLDLPVPNTSHTIDYLGSALLVVAVSALTLLTTWGGTRYAWGSTAILALGAVTLVSAALFFLQEIRVEEPVFPVHLVEHRTFVGVIVLSLCLGAGMFGATIYLPVFLQTVIGVSATNSGLLLLPLVGGLIVTSALTGQLMTRFGRYKEFTVLGGFVGSIGFWLLHTMGPETTNLFTLTALDWSFTLNASTAYMFVTGLGLGFIMPTLTIAVQNIVDRADLGAATTSVTFSRSLGSAVGTAVLGALLTSQLSSRLSDLGGASGGGAGGMSSGGSIDPSVINNLPPQIHDTVVTAIANSIDTVFLAGTGLLVVAFLVALALPGDSLDDEINVQMGEGGAEPMDEPAPSGEGETTVND
ncbi:MAG: MDR family MFS transporter [Haloarculaceae archaeon]